MAVFEDRDSYGIEQFEAVHAQMLRFFPELVSELGGNATDLSTRIGIKLGPSGPKPTYRQMINLIELSAQLLDCRDFGMRLAMRQRGSDMFGPLGHAMRHSPTFGQALEYVTSHSYVHSRAAQIWVRRFPSVKHVFVGHDILLDSLPNRIQAMEQILLIGHLTAMELTGGRARARRVHFRHLPISPLRTYRRHFGCSVHFGQNEDGLSFSDRDLASPIVDPDAEALTTIMAFIDQEFARHHTPLHAQVRSFIMQQLWTGQCTNERIASDLSIHPRTLHRRLTAEGTSFQKIKDEVRRDIMLYYLQQTDLDFSVISEKLGFSEQSVMTRSCNLWFSTSPTKMRSRSET
jgi:AraC-like DNA-binding protein